MRVVTAADLGDGGMRCEGCPHAFAPGDVIYFVEDRDVRDWAHCQACHDRAWRQPAERGRG